MTHTLDVIETIRRGFEPRIGKFKLFVSRSSRVELFAPCSRCGDYRRPLWYYSRTSRGPVYLCTTCKERRMKGKKRDMLDLPQRIVKRSAFETKRRRH